MVKFDAVYCAPPQSTTWHVPTVTKLSARRAQGNFGTDDTKVEWWQLECVHGHWEAAKQTKLDNQYNGLYA